MESIKFTIECLPEDMEIRGNCMASGDDTFDKECEDSIIADLESGNEWAWCCVRVIAEIDGFTGVDYLGGCSYKNEQDFRQGGYFEDMKAEALRDLKTKLLDKIATGQAAKEVLEKLNEIEKPR